MHSSSPFSHVSSHWSTSPTLYTSPKRKILPTEFPTFGIASHPWATIHIKCLQLSLQRENDSPPMKIVSHCYTFIAHRQINSVLECEQLFFVSSATTSDGRFLLTPKHSLMQWTKLKLLHSLGLHSLTLAPLPGKNGVNFSMPTSFTLISPSDNPLGSDFTFNLHLEVVLPIWPHF